MGRRLRYIPPGGALVEVTTRTVQGRFLLRPSQHLNTLVLGVLGRAQRRYKVRIHAFVFLSNHYHLLVSVASAQQLALFMGYFNGNLAKEVARLTGWRHKIWSRRYQAILVSDEELAQVGRLRYILSHGAKEDLVGNPADWPGANCISALLEARPLDGLWFDRTKEFGARCRGEKLESNKAAEPETVRLAPLPCWERLSTEGRNRCVGELLGDIAAETLERRKRDQVTPLGRSGVLAQKPTDLPRKSKCSATPFAHCMSKAARKALWQGYGWFLGAYREAAARLRSGDLAAPFPEGAFRARAPFVGTAWEPG